MKIFTFSILLCIAACSTLVGCSGGGGRSGENSNKPGGIATETGYAPSRFAFEPGTPGRAVGIRAVASMANATLETHQVEIALLEPPGIRASALSAAAPAESDVASNGQALCSTAVGEQSTSLRTAANRVCWIANGFNGGALGRGSTLVHMTIIAGEGRYAVSAGSNDIYYPPDITSLAHVASVGCLYSSDEHVLAERLSGLTGIGISVTVGGAVPVGTFASFSAGYSAGYTIFVEDEGRRYAPAFQYDTSLSSAAISFGPLSVPFQMRMQTDSGFFDVPVLIARHDLVCDAEQSPFEAAEEMSEDERDELDQVADELMQPLIDHLAAEEGYGPAPNMMAGSNADAFGSLGGPGTVDEAGGELPASTLDDLVERSGHALDQGSNDRELAEALGDNASELRNVLPSPELLDGLLRQAAVGSELANEAARRRSEELRFVAPRLIRIDASVGEPVTLTFTAEELATLVGLSEQAVLGATLQLSASHTLSPSDHVLEEAELDLSFTPRTNTPLLIRTKVDLSTAEGPIPDNLRDVEPELALRLVMPRAGAPAIVTLSAAERVAAGGSVTLNAIVTDETGNLSDEPVEVEFFDGEMQSLGVAMSAHGVATLQYVPIASAPAIERIERAELEANDETFPGLRIHGSGFSVDADIAIDGEPLADDVRRSVISAETILVAFEPPAGALVQITNPEGAESNTEEVP